MVVDDQDQVADDSEDARQLKQEPQSPQGGALEAPTTGLKGDLETMELFQDQIADDGEEARQRELGPQSRRGGASMAPMTALKGDMEAVELFNSLFRNEDDLHGQYAVFYHSYSCAALLYEVRAAIAAIRYGYRAEDAPLPRLLLEDFQREPSVKELVHRVRVDWVAEKIDHMEEFRNVAISVMCSLVATGPECCMQVAFKEGYSCKKVEFKKILLRELKEAFPCAEASDSEDTCLSESILTLAEEHGLDVTMFGRKACPSGNAGHVLQIFINRKLVDHLCYPAVPYGTVDDARMPFAQWINGDHSFSLGQARILAHPNFFLKPWAVRMFVISADPHFQASRQAFQRALQALLLSYSKGEQQP